jgi:O-succinylbenzoic acid--CoA ligase
MDFGHWLSGAASRRPDRIAVEAPGESIAYRELLLRAVRAAGALDRRSVRRGTTVALALEPGAAYVEVLHGCLLLGAPVLPVDPRLTIRERFLLLREADVVVEKPVRGESGVFQLPTPPAREDVALVVPTSGTTGRPSLVPLTYGNLHANARGVQRALGLGEDEERWLCPLPLSHVGGLMCVVRSVLMATTVVLAPPPFDAAASPSRPSCPRSYSGCWTPAPSRGRPSGASCSGAGRCRARCSSGRATPASPSARATASRRPAPP